MQASSVTSVLFKNLAFRNEKQKVIASNIANINTPFYKTKDVKFNDYLKDDSIALKVTNNKHFTHFIDEQPHTLYKVYEVKNLQEQNDGNNVDLDKE